MEGDRRLLVQIEEQENFVDNALVRYRPTETHNRAFPDPPAPQPVPADNIALINPHVRWYFFLAGQWFAPVEKIIESRNLSKRGCRIAYTVWQVVVVLIMWSFFLYSMGFFHLRTLEEVDWLCPLTDIKNMIHGLCWIVNQHTGLIFFSFGNLECLLKQLSITKEEVKRRASSSSIVSFLVGSVAWLFVVPISLHATQMLMPDFLSVPRYRNGNITVIKNDTFPPLQVALDVFFYTLSRGFSLPVFYVFLYLLFFLCCEVEKFKDELKNGDYPSEYRAKKKAIKIKRLIKETEKAFRFFLALYITMLLLASALEIFSIVEKAETVITANHTLHFIPASASASSLQTLDLGSQNLMVFPHRLTGKRSIPYLLAVIPPGNHTSVGMGSGGGIPKIVVTEYKLKTQEIVVTAVLDITENVVLYAFPLYHMSVLKSCLKSVVEMVKDSVHGEQGEQHGNNDGDQDEQHGNNDGDQDEQHGNNDGDQDANLRIIKIFNTRQDKTDFTEFFQDTCTSGIRVLGREVSFLWTLVLTFFGPFAVVVVNLMFKHIHVESPLH